MVKPYLYYVRSARGDAHFLCASCAYFVRARDRMLMPAHQGTASIVPAPPGLLEYFCDRCGVPCQPATK